MAAKTSWSRGRALLEQEQAAQAEAVRQTLVPGAVITGRVVSVRDFGAFVDLGAGIQGLLHVSEMGWSRLTSPSLIDPQHLDRNRVAGRHDFSSLGLPKEGDDYHAKVLMSEYITIGHYAVQDSRPTGGWRYYSAPQWFVQGLQEYDAIYHTTETNRARTADTLMKWARQNEGRFACCTNGIELPDAYNGGAAFLAFLAAEFGEGIHERLLRSGASTFDEALASETRPYSQSELLSGFRKWVTDSK